MKKIVKLALILSLLMLSVSFAKSNSAASNNSKSQVTITFKVEGFEDIVWNIKNGHKVNQINDFHKKSGEFAKFVGIVDEWCVVEPKVQRACYTLQKLWSGPKFYSDAVIVGTVKKSFDITFVNYDGKKIVTVPTERDMVPVFPESEKAKLVREKTAKYSYSFKGWTPALVKATANAAYKAVYDSSLNTFKVRFLVDGEQFGDVQIVGYGKDAHFPKAKPTKEGYRFVGWDVAPLALLHLKKDLDVNAKFVKTYKVCYKGAEFDKCTEVDENSVVKVEKLPIDLKNTCTAWTLNGVLFPHKYVTVKKDLNFEGVCHANFVKVRFLVDGEQFGDVQIVGYGKDAHFPKAKPTKEGYRFVGWDVAPLALLHLKKDLDVNAKFVKTYKVCYKGAEFDKCTEVDENSVVKVEKLPVDLKNTCTAWTLNGVVFPHKYVTVKKDLNFEGVCHANFVKVRFLVDGEQFGHTRVIPFGSFAVPPKEIPTKEGYRFVGWDVAPLALLHLKKDLDVNAKFVKTYKVCYKGAEFDKCTEVDENSVMKVEKLPVDLKNTCTAWTLNGVVFPHKYVTVKKDLNFEGVCHANFVKVRFLVDGEQFGDVQIVGYGKDAHFPKAKPTKEGYRFVGWDVAPLALLHLKKDLDVNAKFVKTYKVCYKGAEFDKCTEVDENSVVKVEKLPVDLKNTCTAWTLNGVVFPHKYVTVKKDLNFEGVCHANFVKVRFLVDGEQFGHTRVIPFGSFAVPPKEIPTKEGYRFIGWDKPFVHVLKDLDVNAKFWKTFNVCYEGAGLKKCVVKDSASFVKVPPSVATEDSTCNGWTLDGAVVEGKVVKVKGDLNFQAACRANTHEVLFLVDGAVVDSQGVAHGAAAVKPADPAKEGFIFTEWDSDFSVVESDLKINALFVEAAEVCFNTNEVVACTTVVKGDSVDVPELPGSEDPEGFTCTSWTLDGAAFEATSVKADSNMNFEAVCRANTHEVLFLVDGAVVDSQSVAHGTAAVKPVDPNKEGFAFTGWDTDFSVVESDLKINAMFVETATVCFNANEAAACTTVVKGDSVDVPELPGSEDPDGFTCTSWTFNGAAFEATIVKVDSNITIEAVCHDNANDVKFVAFDTVLVDSQRVNYGEAAVAPADSAIPEFPGYRFNEWDKDFSSVEEDMVVNAVFDTMYTVSLQAFKIKEENAFIDTTIVAVKDTMLYKGFSKTLAQMLAFSCDEVSVNGFAVDFEHLLTSPFVVSGNTKIVAKGCHDATHKVYYFVEDAVLDSEVVAHNTAAQKNVSVPEIANKRFAGWNNSEELKHVVSDLEVKAIYEGVDTVFVMVHGEAFDTIVVASGSSVDYILKTVEDTADSVFGGWKVDKENVAAGATIEVKAGMSIVADFSVPDAIQGVRVANFAVRVTGNQVEVVGAKKGVMMTVLDLQGRKILNRVASNSVETLQLATSGTYLLRVGAVSKMVTIR